VVVLGVFVSPGGQLLDRDAERADPKGGSGAAEADLVEALESLDLLDPGVRYVRDAWNLPALSAFNPVLTLSYHRFVAFERTVAHLDMDAFYASVELRRRPELRGKPVVVCGSGPRAVVTTASYEARRLAGIHSAMPAAVARRRLPDAIYIQPDFAAYREASGQVMAILRANAETVEVVGLDEAYVDLTGIFSPKATMRRIAAEIREETELTCSIGISESRMLAKITSELGKPAGLVVLSREEALERFAGESPGLIPGIGPKSVAKLETMGVRTLAELRAQDPDALERAFGPRQGRWLHARANLIDDTPVVVEHETKSQSAETTFDADVAERAAMEGHVSQLAEELCRRLRKRDLAGRTIGIKVRLDDWTNVTRSHTLEAPTNDPAVVGTIALDLLRAYDPPRPVRLLGVRVAGFGGEDGERSQATRPADPQLRLGIAA
jgi:DNA polymerase IV